jgi:hypothetical protein
VTWFFVGVFSRLKLWVRNRHDFVYSAEVYRRSLPVLKKLLKNDFGFCVMVVFGWIFVQVWWNLHGCIPFSDLKSVSTAYLCNVDHFQTSNFTHLHSKLVKHHYFWYITTFQAIESMFLTEFIQLSTSLDLWSAFTSIFSRVLAVYNQKTTKFSHFAFNLQTFYVKLQQSLKILTFPLQSTRFQY